jgi:hypothetical protein
MNNEDLNCLGIKPLFPQGALSSHDNKAISPPTPLLYLIIYSTKNKGIRAGYIFDTVLLRALEEIRFFLCLSRLFVPDYVNTEAQRHRG